MSIEIVRAQATVRNHNISMPAVIIVVWHYLHECGGSSCSSKQLRVATAPESAWIYELQFPLVSLKSRCKFDLL